MYGQDAKVAMTPKDTPAFELTVNRFAELNALQSKILYEIEDKLHLLLNRRLPQAEALSRGAEAPMDSDVYSKTNRQIDSIDQANRRLQDILKHLEQIV